MFKSLKYKTLVFITCLMGLTAAAILVFTHRDVGKAMLAAEQASAQNVLKLVELNISAGYNRLIYDKIEILSRLESELKHISAICNSVMLEYIKLAGQGNISMSDAYDLAFRWIRSLNLEKIEFFVFTREGTIIAHSAQKLLGVSIAELRDLKGRPVAKVMRDDILEDHGDAAVFLWKPADNVPETKKWGFFGPFAPGVAPWAPPLISATSRWKASRKWPKSLTCSRTPFRKSKSPIPVMPFSSTVSTTS